MDLTLRTMGLTLRTMGLTQRTMGLTQRTMGLTQRTMGPGANDEAGDDASPNTRQVILHCFKSNYQYPSLQRHVMASSTMSPITVPKQITSGSHPSRWHSRPSPPCGWLAWLK
jgi:hypothetical protein